MSLGASKFETTACRFIVTFFTTLTWSSLSPAAESAKIETILKFDPVARTGQCLLQYVSNEQEVNYWLDRYQIQTQDLSNKKKPARPEELSALASGLQQLEALWGGLFKPAVNTRFTFETSHSYSNQAGVIQGKGYNPESLKLINMKRCSSVEGCKSNNVAHLMHELCHQIGHTPHVNGRTFQDNFAASVGANCRVSNYSHTNLSEQFAEACSSFVTRPERLFEKNQNCQRTFHEFFAKTFPNGRLASCNDPNKKLQLASALPNSGTMVALRHATLTPVGVAIVNTGATTPASRRPATQVASMAGPGDDNFDTMGDLCKTVMNSNFDDMLELMIAIKTSTKM